MNNNTCPCGSGQLYEKCCKAYHENYDAPTALALMRSRYSAFVLGFVDYLFATTHPHHRAKNLKAEIAFTCKELTWTKLTVLSSWQGEQNDKVGKVSFAASFLQKGIKGLHREDSRFKRFGKAWMYVDGDITE